MAGTTVRESVTLAGRAERARVADLDGRGLRNHVLVITRHQMKAGDIGRLNQLVNLKVTLLFTYSGIEDTRIEPYPSAVAVGSLKLMSAPERRRYRNRRRPICFLLRPAAASSAISSSRSVSAPEAQRLPRGRASFAARSCAAARSAQAWAAVASLTRPARSAASTRSSSSHMASGSRRSPDRGGSAGRRPRTPQLTRS